MLSYRYDLDVFNAPRDIDEGSSATEAPVYEPFPDSGIGFNPASRTVVYSRGIPESQLVQKDRGHEFISNTASVAISSEFSRDNIHLLPNYSEQLLVHRILPEVNNLNEKGLPTVSTGNITIQVGGADSVGQSPSYKPAVTMEINTSNPWTQIDQNVFRLNSIIISNTSSVDTWICPGITWQFTPTQDSR
jgi:NADPH-dependent 7-cyano-7-deazaguanine reductase QueF-like protein